MRKGKFKVICPAGMTGDKHGLHTHLFQLAVKENVCYSFTHTSDIFVDPAGVQRLEDLLAAVHPAHCLSLKFGCFL